IRPTTKGTGPTYRSLRHSLRYIIFSLKVTRLLEEEDNQSTLGALVPYTSQLSHFHLPK
ncbi:hypothetical protein C1646_719095, partial [Rhizophagus diaphanus]